MAKKFFAVIIGSEILDNRRVDKHFNFIRDEFLKRGYSLSGSFVIKDDKNLIDSTFEMIKNIPDSVMFSFGGIGSTPDDLTREISAKVFRNSEMEFNNEFKTLIEEKFKNDAYPYRINMSYLPTNSKLLKENPINKMCGYYLDDRFFFVPGFPEMAHPMILEALNNLFPPIQKQNRFTLIANIREGEIVDIMQKLPENIDFSSLPMINGSVEISMKSQKWFEFFKKELIKRKIDIII